jgi:hypothetical protein
MLTFENSPTQGSAGIIEKLVVRLVVTMSGNNAETDNLVAGLAVPESRASSGHTRRATEQSKWWNLGDRHRRPSGT